MAVISLYYIIIVDRIIILKYIYLDKIKCELGVLNIDEEQSLTELVAKKYKSLRSKTKV